MTQALARTETGANRVRPLKASRFWWKVHQWAGLKLSILLGFVLLTGALATVSNEIDWLLQPAMRVDMATVEGPVAWASIARNAAAYAPEARITSIAKPVEPFFAARVTIEDQDGDLRYLYAHPSTGDVQGSAPWVGAQRILRNMHRHLNLPVAWGVPIVCAMALLLLATLITSLIVYKKWWRGFLKPIRTRDARTGWGDFHRLAGVWSLWFLLLMIVTGIWYLAEQLAASAPPHPSVESIAGGLSNPAMVSRLNDSLAAARAAWPELRISRVQFPGEESGTFVIQGQDRALLVRERSNSVWTDARTGTVLLIADGRDLGVHQRISEMADPLHFGNFGGLATKLTWFLFGMLLTALAVSGAAIHGLRLLRERRDARSARYVSAQAWSGMGRWRWLALAGVATGLVLLPPLIMGQG